MAPNLYYVYVAGCCLVTQGLTVVGDECTEVPELSSRSPSVHGQARSAPTKDCAKLVHWDKGVRSWHLCELGNRTPRLEVAT